MHIKLLYLSVLMMITLAVSAQKNLVVYHTAGDVSIITNKTAAAKRGDALTTKSSLQLKPGATCMLIEATGKSLQVNTAGTYTFPVLQKMITTAKSSGVTSKFFTYVYENLFSSEHDDKLSVTPVVFRGEDLMKAPANNTIIIADAFTVSWKKPTAKKIPVHLIFSDSADNILFDTVVKQSTSLLINLEQDNFSGGKVYKWKAEEAGTHQPKEKYFYFLIPEKKDRKRVLNDLKLLQDKNSSAEFKDQVQQDIFHKWEKIYSVKD